MNNFLRRNKMGKCKFLRVGLLVVASALALGSAAFFGCSQAGEPEHTHSYKAVVTPPTCTERGYTTYSCECGDSYVDSYVNALGHNLTEHSGQAATCTQSGWNNYVTCSRCDYTTYTALPAKGHTPSAPVRGNETPASCTSEGSYDEVVYCTVCDTEISRTPHTVAKLAHTPSAPVVAKLAHTPSAPVRENETPASCTSEGSYDEVVYCSVCDTEISRTHKIIEKLPHKYVNRVCEVCGAIDGLIAFATLDVNGYQVSGTLSNDTAVFSFINEVTVDDGATYTVCTDMACTQVIPSKTVNLNVGDNIYYILVSQGNDVQLYTVTLRRHPIYSVTFNTDGGTSVEAQEVEEESYLHAPEEPQKEGYTFVEWQFEDQTVTFPVQVMENMQLTAIYTANIYDITLDVNGGEPLDEAEYEATFDGVYTLPVPQREGYTFLGWYESDIAVTAASGNSLSVWKYTDNMQLEARWSINSYALSLDKNIDEAGSISGDGENVFDSQVTVTAQTNAGYTFLGWFSGEELLSEEPEYTFAMPAEDIALTAKWEVNSYMLTLDENIDEAGDALGGGEKEYNSQVTVTAQANAGYTFLGWYDGEKLLSQEREYTFVMPAEALNLTARWSINSYVLALDKNIDGAGSVSDGGEQVYNSQVTITAQTNLGYTFLGWYNGEELLSEEPKYTFAMPAQQLTLTAKWQINEEIADFTFTSTPTTCTITGLTDESLNQVTIPDYVTSIGSSAFEDCTSLESVEIPSSVTSIGYRAFRDCGSLTSIIIPSSITYIGSYAFENCTSLTAVYITDLEAWCNISFDSVSSNPLYYAHNLYLNGELVTDIVIPDGVTSIDYAFYNCTSLTSITIPSSVASIGTSHPFWGCSKLIIYCEAAEKPYSWNSEWNYYVNYQACPVVWDCNNNSTDESGYSYSVIDGLRYGFKNGTAAVALQSVTISGDIVISSSVTYNGAVYPVTGIMRRAFYNCGGLTGITIPSSVTIIDGNAFEGCDGLETVYITDLGAWCNIIFDGSYYTNPLYYAHNLYLNGELVTELVIPEGVTDIGEYVFYGCTSITSVTLPASVTNIGYYAFENCTSLTAVYITDLEAWCNISFGYFSSNPLTYAHNLYLNGELVTGELVIPEGATNIGSYAFSGCNTLTGITIPLTVTSIGEGAFSGCSSLESITLPFVGGSANAESESGSTLFGYIFGTSSYSGGTATEQSIRI